MLEAAPGGDRGGGGLPRYGHRHGRRPRRHAVATCKRRRPSGRVARAVRLLPLDRLDPAAALRHRDRVRGRHRPGRMARGAGAPGRDGAAGEPVQPDAGDGGPPGGLRAGARGRGAGVVDNVFATPLLQKPFELGADVVVYSCTKHIDGQGRVLGGAVLGRKAWVEDTLQPFIRNTGPSLSPFNAWLLLKGLETLALRVRCSLPRSRRPSRTFLAGAPGDVPRLVSRPAPTTRSTRSRCRRWRLAAPLVTFELAGGKAAAFAAMNALRVDRRVEQPRRLQVARDAPRDHHAYADRRRGADAAGHHRWRDPALGRAGGRGT